MEYRKDIQILRGIAVLLVVFFHLEVTGFYSGFLGVDVFFVISGYLMAVMYNPLNKSEFFVKRAKRLLPAYFAVVVATLLIAIAITKPVDYIQVSNEAMFAAFFASNIGFWMENSYFDKAAFKPLLHLWSLGVEVQFYLLIPVLYWAFKKFRIALPLILLASFSICFVMLSISPKTAFFWLPFRLWEFLLGFIVAKHVYRGEGNKYEVLTWLGSISLVVIICIPFANVNGEQEGFMRGHPGLAAFLITIATATTLSFGIHKIIEKNRISTLLEKIGRYSYSIYLAHFPVIVLFLYQPFSGTVLKTTSKSQSVLLGILVIIASTLLFMLVEKPFRTGGKVLRLAVASVAVILGISLLGTKIQKAFIPEKEMLIYQAWSDRSEYRCGKIKRIINPSAISCEITGPINKPLHRVLLVGNSHADSIKSTFSTVAQAANVSVYFMVTNEPLMEGDSITPERLIEEALTKHIDTIVLHYSPNAIDYSIIKQLAMLAKPHKINLSVIMPVPVWGKHIPKMLIKNMAGTEGRPSQNISDYQNFNADRIRRLNDIEYDKFRFYKVADVFCRPDCQFISDAGKPLYFDNSHLTLTGSEMLAPVFFRLINELN